MKLKSVLLTATLIAAGLINIKADGSSEKMLKHPRPLAEKIVISENGKAKALIITGKEDLATAETLQKSIEKKYRVKCPIIMDTEFDLKQNRENMIILGNLASNKVSEYLYCRLYTYEDRYFPGKKGYVLRTVLDPFGNGTNLVILGGSSADGVANAEKYFLKQLIKDDNSLFIKPQLKVVWGSKPGKYYRSFPWKMTAGRGPLNAAVRYLRTGDPQYAEKYKRGLYQYLQKPSHLQSYYGTMLWEAMESSGAFSDKERLEICNKLLNFFRGEQGIGYLTKGYLEQLTKPLRRPRVIGNHQTRAAMGMYFGWRYFNKYFNRDMPSVEMAAYYKAVQDIMNCQIASYRTLDESHSQHGFGGTLDNMLVIGIAEPDLLKDYLSSGLGRKMADYVYLQCNNLGRMSVNGDGGGITIPANLFSKLAYLYNDGRYLYIANKAGAGGVSTDEPIRGFVSDLKAIPPIKHLGVVAIAPVEANLAVEPFEDHTVLLSYAEKQFGDKSFDKLSFRGGLTKDSAYLAIDGLGGFSHAYSDQNSIVEFSQNGFVWVCEPDQFSYSGIDCHNSLTYTTNGLGPLNVPVAAKLLMTANTQEYSYSLTELPEYGDIDWYRHVLFFRESGPFLVLDVIKPHKDGGFRTAVHWHILGEAEYREGNIRAFQRSRNNKAEAGFSLDYPQNAGISMHHKTDETRLKLMKRSIILNAATKFNAIVLSREAELKKGERTSFLSMLRSDRKMPEEATINQLSALSFMLEFKGQKYIIAIPDKSGQIKADKLCIEADFALITDKQLFLANPKAAVIGGYNYISKPKPGGHVIKITDEKYQKIIEQAIDRLAKTKMKDQAVPSIKNAIAGVSAISSIKRFKITDPKQFTSFVNRDGKTVIAVGAYDGSITLLDHSLQVLKTTQVKPQLLSLTTGDIDGDGLPELLAGTEKGWICALDSDNLKLRWQTCVPQQNQEALWYSMRGNQVINLAVANLNGKAPLIFAGMGDETLQALSADGKRLWNRLLQWGLANKLAAGKFLPDKNNQIAVGIGIISMSAKLYLFDASGEIKSCVNIPAGYGSSVTAMLTGHFMPGALAESLVGTSSGLLIMYHGDKNGTIQPVWIQNLDQKINGIARLSNPSKQDIFVIGSENGFIHGFSPAGKQKWVKYLQQPVNSVVCFPQQPLAAAVLNRRRVIVLDSAGNLLGKAHFEDEIRQLDAIDKNTLLVMCEKNLYLINISER